MPNQEIVIAVTVVVSLVIGWILGSIVATMKWEKKIKNTHDIIDELRKNQRFTNANDIPEIAARKAAIRAETEAKIDAALEELPEWLEKKDWNQLCADDSTWKVEYMDENPTDNC